MFRKYIQVEKLKLSFSLILTVFGGRRPTPPRFSGQLMELLSFVVLGFYLIVKLIKNVIIFLR
jgi:hypothetical protein